MKKLLLVFALLLVSCESPSFEARELGAFEAVQKGGEWFLNNQDESFIYYQYYPGTDVHPDKHHSAREMGALWSITRLAEFLEDPRYDELALRGWTHFSETFVEDEAGFYYVNITPQKIKLSYNAFAILSLLELEEVAGRAELLEGLATGILQQQEESGELRTFFFSDRSTGVDYYPGQALLALMLLYEETGEEEYVQAVGKAFPYYQAYFEETPVMAFVPWQTQAYYEYYQVQPNDEVAQYIFDMNDAVLEDFGGCGSLGFEKGIVTAVYIEGMNKAYLLAEERGDGGRSRCYGHFIQEGSEAVIALQFPVEGQNSEDFAEAAWGGFFGSKNNGLQQVDRNQHAVMALMGAYELGLVK
jgi:hypothetical protein